MTNRCEKKIDYPAEMTFKSIFRNREGLLDSIKCILSENGLEGDIYHRESKNGKFISYTITAVFPSETVLNDVCNKVGLISGYMTKF